MTQRGAIAEEAPAFLRASVEGDARDAHDCPGDISPEAEPHASTRIRR